MIFQCSLEIPALSISEKSDLLELIELAILSPQKHRFLSWMPAEVNSRLLPC